LEVFMPGRSYKVGDTTTTGHVVAEILGQSPAACIYTSTKDDLRWSYYANDGVLPDEHGAVVAKFDTLMDEIKGLDGALESKRPLFTLLGKNLFIALNATKPGALPDIFSRVEKKIAEYANAASRGGRAPGRSAKPIPSPFDLAVVCALHEPELEAVFSFSKWTNGPRMPSDPQTYYSSTWTTKGNKKLRVVVAAPNQMGLTASAVLSAKMILQFRPKMLAMAGIAAGARSTKQGFGDILVPDQTFDYGSGKTTSIKGESKILPSPNPIQMNAKLLGRLKEWQRERTGLDQISKAWQAAKPNTRLSLHIGPMFSSPTVADSAQPVEDMLNHWRKLIGLEMEAHAVHRACNDTIDPGPLFLCAKSICDFAENKSDDWQHYAAYTSARFIHRFVLAEWMTLFE
jgi:nucleoside phosphorylase